jgi:hypothetical protein
MLCGSGWTDGVVEVRGSMAGARELWSHGGRQGSWATGSGARGPEELAAVPVAGAEQEAKK